MKDIFYHFTLKSEWEKAKKTGFYVTDSIKLEGFIHGSQKQQVMQSLKKHAPKSGDLVLLVIEPSKVIEKIVLENTSGGTELFPHIYGELNVTAVEQVMEIGRIGVANYSIPNLFGDV